MLTKKQKDDIVKDISKELNDAQGVYFLGFHGLTMAQLNNLRSKLKGTQAKARVVKKTLTNLALKSAGLNDKDVRQFDGSLLMLIAKDDILPVAKALWSFSAKNDKVQIFGGVIDKKFVTKENVIALAKLPAKEVLLGQLVGSLASPMRNFVWVWQSQINKLVYALDAIKAIK